MSNISGDGWQTEWMNRDRAEAIFRSWLNAIAQSEPGDRFRFRVVITRQQANGKPEDFEIES